MKTEYITVFIPTYDSMGSYIDCKNSLDLIRAIHTVEEQNPGFEFVQFIFNHAIPNITSSGSGNNASFNVQVDLSGAILLKKRGLRDKIDLM